MLRWYKIPVAFFDARNLELYYCQLVVASKELVFVHKHE